MATSTLLFICFFLVSIVHGKQFVQMTNSTFDQVVQMTNSNFDELVKNHKLVVINFYADWCHFSQILAPVFEETYSKVLKEFSGRRILFTKVNCEVEADLAGRFHISKYPTLKLVMNRKPMKKEYRGQRSVDAIFNHVKNIMKDPVQSVITSSDFGEKIDEKKAAIIGYFKALPGAVPDYNTFQEVAIDLRDDCNFYWVTGEPTVVHLQHTDSKITFKGPRSKPADNDLVYPGNLTSYEELSTWVTDKCIPLVREITFENAEELTEEGLPFLILFHHPNDRTSIGAYRRVIHQELFTESSSINFLTADGVKFAHPLHHLGKTQSDLPLIAIDSFRHMYLFPNFRNIEIPGKLKQFVLDLHSGKLHREFHFGPDPSGNELEITSPPESTFKKLAPSSSRYTLLRDEL